MVSNKDLSTPNTMTKSQEKQIQMLEDQKKELHAGLKVVMGENKKIKDHSLITIRMSEELKKSMDEDEKRALKLQKRIKELEGDKEKEEEDMRNDFNAEFEIKLREAEKKLKDKSLEEELKLKKREKKLKKKIRGLQEYQTEVDNMENVLVNDYPEISDEWRYYEIPGIIKKHN